SGVGTLEIDPLGITGSFTADDKIYDGNASAVVLTRSVSGEVAGDNVALSSGTATFSDKNVDTGKTVTLTGATLAGGDAGNYTLTSVSTTTADITQLDISGTFTADNKTYDGSTNAIVSGTVVVGMISGDDVALSGG